MAEVVNLGQRFLSAIVSRAKTAALLGKQFGTKRDLYEALGYPKTLTFDHYKARYERGGIASRVVRALPQATWRNPPILKEVGVRSTDSEFVQKFNTLEKRTALFAELERADRLAGIGRYAILLIGIRASGQLISPVRLSTLRNEKDVLYFSSYTEGRASIEMYDSNPMSERFGEPSLYSIDLLGDVMEGSPSRGTPTINQQVHWTRLIHIAEGLDEDRVYGKPRLEPIWNYLEDLDKVMGGTAEAIWRTVDRGIQFDVDKDAELGDEELNDISEEIDEYMHGLRRYLRTQGVTANVLGSELPDPRGAFEAILSLISGTAGIPQRILLGSERGQLASSSDERNFNARVKERQVAFAEPNILRPTVDRLMEVGVLPRVEYTVEWPDLSTLTAREQADVAARMGQAARSFSEALSQPVLTREEVREQYFKLPRDPEFDGFNSSDEDDEDDES